MKNKICIVCGAEIKGSGKKYCSKTCFCNRNLNPHKYKKFDSEISRINSLAIKENLTYGKYVAKYGV